MPHSELWCASVTVIEAMSTSEVTVISFYERLLGGPQKVSHNRQSQRSQNSRL